MHNHVGIQTPAASPLRKGLPGWLIVLIVVIVLTAAAAVVTFAVQSYREKQFAMQQNMFVIIVASHNMVDVKKYLDANPSLVNAVGASGLSPLGMAASNGDIAMMKLLITRKADVNGRAHAGYTPLHEAAVSNQTEAVKLLFTNGAKVGACTDTGYTPLSIAAMMGTKEVAEVLIAHGANVNVKTNDGSTPLTIALNQLAKLGKLPTAVTQASKAQTEQGDPLFVRPTPERCRQMIQLLRQNGGIE